MYTIVLIGTIVIVILCVALLIAPLKLYSIHKELKQANEQLAQVNRHLRYSHELQKSLADAIRHDGEPSTMLEREAAQPPISSAAAKRGICQYCGGRAQEDETCEECRQKGG